MPVGGNTNFAAGTGSGGNAFVPSVSPSNLDYQPISPAAGMGSGQHKPSKEDPLWDPDEVDPKDPEEDEDADEEESLRAVFNKALPN